MKLTELLNMLLKVNRDHPVARLWQRYAQSEQDLRQALAGMSPELKPLFKVLMRFAGPLPFEANKLDEWHGQCEQYPIGYVQAALPLYMKLGLVAQLELSWGEQAYVIPQEIYEAASHDHLMENRLVDDLSYGSPMHELLPVMPSATIEAGEEAVQDLFRIMVLAAQGELSFTSKGVLQKKIIQRLEGMLRIEANALKADGFLCPTAPFLSSRLALILELACAMKMIAPEPDGYKINAQKLHYWLDSSVNHWRRALHEIVRKQYVRADVEMHQGIIAIEQCGHSSEWRSVSKVLKYVESTYGCSNRSMGWLRDWLLASHALGLCDLGRLPEGEWYYRWKAVPLEQQDACSQEEGPQLFVQPDFEIMTVPECSFRVRYELEMMAELQASEPLSIYKLRFESFKKALERGRAREWQLEFLRLFAVNGVPSSVEDALLQWSLQLNKVHIQEALLVRCQDEEAFERIQVDCQEDIQHLRLVPIGSKDYILADEHAEDIAKKLTRMGLLSPPKSRQEAKGLIPPFAISVRPSEEGEIHLGEQEFKEEMMQDLKGTVYSIGRLKYYEMDADLLAETMASAPYYRLPEMWTKSMRTYHASTMRELIQTAIELRLSIEVELSNHERRLLTPWRLQSTPAELTLLEASLDNSNRLNRVSFDPKQIKGVRILLPAWL